MADFSLPDLDSKYEPFTDAIKANDETVARWFDGTTDTNIPTGAKRWSTVNKRFEMFDGATWGPLVPIDSNPDNAYHIRVERANECSGNAATAGLATNALNLGGVPADEYARTDDVRLADSRPCNNTFDNAVMARAALSVSSQAEVAQVLAVALAPKADLASPALTDNPTCPTQEAGNNSTRIASTAFVAAAVAAYPSCSFGAWVNLALASTWSSLGVCRVRPVLQNSVVIAYDFEIEAGNMGVQWPTTLIASIPAPYRPTYAKRYYGVGEWFFDGESQSSGLSVVTFNTNGNLVANVGSANIYFRERLWV